MKKTAAVVAPALLAAAALALSGCSAQLSQADTCAQMKSILDVSKSAPSGASDSQKTDRAKAEIEQVKDLSGKASDDLKGDLGTMADGLDKRLQALQRNDTAAVKAIVDSFVSGPYGDATHRIVSTCKISS